MHEVLLYGSTEVNKALHISGFDFNVFWHLHWYLDNYSSEHSYIRGIRWDRV